MRTRLPLPSPLSPSRKHATTGASLETTSTALNAGRSKQNFYFSVSRGSYGKGRMECLRFLSD